MKKSKESFFKKPKIMYVLTTNSYSGAENVIIKIIQTFSKYDYGFDMVYVSKDGPIREYLEDYHIAFVPIKSMSVWELHKVIKLEQPDIIHANDFRASIISAFSCYKIPIISHLHNNTPWLKHFNLYSFLYFISTIRYRAILTVSPSIHKEYVFGKLIEGKVKIVKNPIDIETIREKAELPINYNINFHIAFLGRLSTPKDPISFLKIVCTLKEKIPTLSTVMIGDGSLLQECKDFIKTHRLNTNVSLIGFQKNPYPYLKLCKVLCMPSKWEGYGLAAVEALALNIPVVGSKIGGLPLIVNDSCGKLCSSESEFVDELYKLLTDASYYNDKQLGAYFRAQELNNIQYYAENLSTLYKNIVNI